MNAQLLKSLQLKGLQNYIMNNFLQFRWKRKIPRKMQITKIESRRNRRLILTYKKMKIMA